MKVSVFKRRRRIRALIVGLAVAAVALPVGAEAAAEPGRRFPPAGTRIVSGEAGIEWSSLAVGAGIALCVLLAAAVGLFVTRRRDPALSTELGRPSRGRCSGGNGAHPTSRSRGASIVVSRWKRDVDADQRLNMVGVRRWAARH